MKIDIFDKNGKSVEKATLSDEVFGIEPRTTLLRQYIRVVQNNKRQGTSAAKTRAEVSGGGRKPYRQKGTGRARAGSTRSPLWRHGGIIHGPKPKSWSLSFPKKMRRLAMLSALSIKAAENKIIVVDQLKFDEPKITNIESFLKNNNVETKKGLIVLNENDMVVRKSANNLPMVRTVLLNNLSAYDVLKSDTLIFTKDSLEKLEEKYKA